MALIRASAKTNEPEASAPYTQLATAMLVRAVEDLKVRDPLRSADALCYWLDPEGGVTMLEALGIELPVDRVFQVICKGAKDVSRQGKRKVGRRSLGGIPGDEPGGAGTVPA